MAMHQLLVTYILMPSLGPNHGDQVAMHPEPYHECDCTGDQMAMHP